MEAPQNGWNEWSRHVLAELTRLNKEQEVLYQQMKKIQQEVTILKTELRIKAGIWGVIGAAIPLIVLIALKFLKI